MLLANFYFKICQKLVLDESKSSVATISLLDSSIPHCVSGDYLSLLVGRKENVLSVDKKNQLHVTSVFFISLLPVTQYVSGNQVPIIRSWRLRDIIASCWYVPWLQAGCQGRLASGASMDGFVAHWITMPGQPQNALFNNAVDFSGYTHTVSARSVYIHRNSDFSRATYFYSVPVFPCSTQWLNVLSALCVSCSDI